MRNVFKEYEEKFKEPFPMYSYGWSIDISDEERYKMCLKCLEENTKYQPPKPKNEKIKF